MRCITIATQCLLVITVLALYFYFNGDFEREIRISNEFHFTANEVQSEVYKKWHKCIMTNLSQHRGDEKWLWGNIAKEINACEFIIEPYVTIHSYSNRDETKRHAIPLNNDPSIVVTFGIGQDTGAEEKLKAEIANVTLYGADPIYAINAEKYEKIGHFFNFAVGPNSGMLNLSVLIGKQYTRRIMPMVDAIYFFKNILQTDFIDNVWIDIEKAEYDLFEYFYRNGKFDMNGIVICQWNVEIHSPDMDGYIREPRSEKQMIHDLFFTLLDDKRYGFFKSTRARNLRQYFLNFADKRCLDKYVRKTDQ